MTTTNYVTDQVKALIGYESEWRDACDEVERGAVRRFVQAIMDDDPVYWNDQEAAKTRYEAAVAPPLFPLHAFRRPPGTPDPLSRVAEERDFDGVTRDFGMGLPPVAIPLPRLLNGGNEVEVYQLARPGERIRAKSKILDIFQKEGKSGPLVFLMVETTYCNEKGDLLLQALQSHILR